jgi:hypothetical protein
MDMPKCDDTKVAGNRTSRDWCEFRDDFNLPMNRCPEIWGRAFDEYFEPRLNTRYLDPIAAIQDIRKSVGEGFSMMAVLCTLIEFLESTFQGKKYRHLKRGETQQDMGEHEYSRSEDIFVSFLINRNFFSTQFSKPGLAKDFYESIRCGLLHEARTKNGWKIRDESSDGSMIDSTRKIVYRDDFHAAITDYIKWYRKALQTDHLRQEAFVRKFDHLCE